MAYLNLHAKAGSRLAACPHPHSPRFVAMSQPRRHHASATLQTCPTILSSSDPLISAQPLSTHLQTTADGLLIGSRPSIYLVQPIPSVTNPHID